MKRDAHLIKARQIDTERLSMLNIQIFQTETKVQRKRLREYLVILHNPRFLGCYGIRITIKILFGAVFKYAQPGIERFCSDDAKSINRQDFVI
jgi:hypothetical protein